MDSLWTYLDKNGDGKISKEEWVAAFTSVDTDGDGRITRKEFASFTENNLLFDTIPKKKMAVLTLHDWNTFFDGLDDDGDGHLSVDEIQKIEREDAVSQDVKAKVRDFEVKRASLVLPPTGIPGFSPLFRVPDAAAAQAARPEAAAAPAPAAAAAEVLPRQAPKAAEPAAAVETSPASPGASRVRESVRNSVSEINTDLAQKYILVRTAVTATFKKPKKETDTQRLKLDALRDMIEKGEPPSKRPDPASHILFRKEDEEWRKVSKAARAGDWKKEDLVAKYLELAETMMEST